MSFICFMCILWQLFLNLTYLFRNTNWYKLNIPIFRTEKENTIDVVLIGGSSVYEGWNPLQAYKEQGIISYNYSVASAPAATYIMAIQDIKETQSPRLFIIDVRKFCSIHWNTTMDGELRHIMDSQNINIKRLASIEYYRRLNDLSIKDALSEYIDLIYYHSNTEALTNKLNWQLSDNRLESNQTDVYFENGFYAGTSHTFMEQYCTQYPVSGRSVLQKAVKACYVDLLEYCQINKVPLLLIASPFAMTEDDAKELSCLEEIAREHDVPFFNMNKFYNDMRLDFHTDFVDTQHLNIYGASKFTSFLADYLNKNYDLPDHRGEPLFEIWDKKYEDYCKYETEEGLKLKSIINDKEQAIKDELTMRTSNNIAEWLFLASNSNMAMLMLRTELSDNILSEKSLMLLNGFGLKEDMLEGSSSYIGYYSGKSIFVSTEEQSYAGTIDKMWGPRDDIDYLISAINHPQVCVNGVNYYTDCNGGVFIVVLDINTGEIADLAIINVEANGELSIHHKLIEE